MTAKKEKETYVPHNSWAYVVTIQTEQKYKPYNILIVSKTKLTLVQVIQRFKTNDYPDARQIKKIKHANAQMIHILE